MVIAPSWQSCAKVRSRSRCFEDFRTIAVARSPDINSTTTSRGIVNVPRILNPTKIFLRQQKASAQAGAFLRLDGADENRAAIFDVQHKSISLPKVPIQQNFALKCNPAELCAASVTSTVQKRCK